MTSSTALANEGLFELTRYPLLTQAILLSLAKTTEETGRLTKFRQNFGFFTLLQAGFSVVSANDETTCINKGHQVSSKSPLLARVVMEVMSKETDVT